MNHQQTLRERKKEIITDRVMNHWSLLDKMDWKNSLLAAFIAVVIATGSGLLFAGEYVENKISKGAYSLVEGKKLEQQVDLHNKQVEKDLAGLKEDVREMRKDTRQVLNEVQRLLDRLENRQ